MSSGLMASNIKSYNNTFFHLLLAGWFIIGCLQAFFTSLLHDEAYYWMYSEYLDWGYFHQPPMIALMIKAGYLLFQNELGVRLVSILFSTAGLYLLGSMLKVKDYALLAMLFLSIILAHGGNLFAVPDSPLIFFTALLLFVFKKYLEKDSWLLGLLLGIISACLLYSKYHGIVILFLLVLFNLKLLRRRTFWIIPIVTIILFVPHIIWQIENDFASLKFHLFDRDSVSYNWTFTTDYILGQLLVTGPLMGFLLFYCLIKFKPADAYERTIKYLSAGIFVFFLLLSFRNRVEANWTAAGIIPLILMAHIYISKNIKLVKVVKTLFFISFPLLILLRVLFAFDLVPIVSNFQKEMHNPDVWAKNIEDFAGDRPVIFYNSYQKPSVYHFHTGKPSLSWSLNGHAGNQFNLWDMEETLQNKDVLLITPYENRYTVTLNDQFGKEMYALKMDGFRSYNYIKLEPDWPDRVLRGNEKVHIQVKMINQLDSIVTFIGNQGNPVRIKLRMEQNRLTVYDTVLVNISGTKIERGKTMDFTVRMPDKPGKYKTYFSISADPLLIGKNSESMILEIR